MQIYTFIIIIIIWNNKLFSQVDLMGLLFWIFSSFRPNSFVIVSVCVYCVREQAGSRAGEHPAKPALHVLSSFFYQPHLFCIFNIYWLEIISMTCTKCKWQHPILICYSLCPFPLSLSLALTQPQSIYSYRYAIPMWLCEYGKSFARSRITRQVKTFDAFISIWMFLIVFFFVGFQWHFSYLDLVCAVFVRPPILSYARVCVCVILMTWKMKTFNAWFVEFWNVLMIKMLSVLRQPQASSQLETLWY